MPTFIEENLSVVLGMTLSQKWSAYQTVDIKRFHGTMNYHAHRRSFIAIPKFIVLAWLGRREICVTEAAAEQTPLRPPETSPGVFL